MKFPRKMNLQLFSENTEPEKKDEEPPKDDKKGEDDDWKSKIEAQLADLKKSLTTDSKTDTGKPQVIPKAEPPADTKDKSETQQETKPPSESWGQKIAKFLL